MTVSPKPLLAVLVPVAVIAVWTWLSPYYSTIVFWELRKSVFLLATVLVLAVLAGAMWFHVDSLDRGNSSLTGLAMLLYAATTIALVVAGGFYAFSVHPYQQDATYATSVRVQDGGVPTFGQRAPFGVAQAQARPNLGDTPGDIAVTAYLPARDTFTTLVEARGIFAGYQLVLGQRIPLTGRGAGRTCDFNPAADARLSGWFGHNLGRRITELSRGVNYSTADAYAFCDPATNTPRVVVPLKEQDGLFVVTERPAGVAVYDGATDALMITADTAAVPGPSYPLSLATAQRDATQATGSWTDYLFNRVGWELSDEEDALNSSGSSEYVLPAQPGGEVYATPLTGRGSATSISAISTIPAGTRGTDLASLTVHRLQPDWLSAGAISQRIRADYQDLPNWQNLALMELAPLDGSRWAATIGNGQNVLYRVTGTGSLADAPPENLAPASQPTCLEKVTGSTLTLVRCGTVFNVGGNGPGVQPGAAGQPAAGGGPDLTGVPSDQLVAEVQRRLTQAGGNR